MRLSVEVFDANGRPKANCGRPLDVRGTTASAADAETDDSHESDGTTSGGFTLSSSSSFSSSRGWQVLNEVALHRGRSPHLTVVDAYVNGQHLTEAVADGLILATPTGSTAYSLSSGGPIAHPAVDCMLLTPIAPRSLSFRTLLLPTTGEVVLRISPTSRNPGSELSIDGREVCVLEPGEYVKVGKSEYPMPCVMRRQQQQRRTASEPVVVEGDDGTNPQQVTGGGPAAAAGGIPSAGDEDDWVADIK